MKLSSWLYGICVIFVFFSCSGVKKKSSKTKILTTTNIIADAVYNIVSDKYEVVSLMKEGVDPHMYKATRNDTKKIRNADLIFYNGLHLEGKMNDILEKIKIIDSTKVFAVTENLNKNLLISVGHQLYDPHVWFDIDLWTSSVSYIFHILLEKYPKDEKVFTNNYKNYIKKLEKLNKQVITMINQIPEKQRILITSHDAFAYFSKKYNIKTLSLQGISTLSDFSIKDIELIVNEIITNNVKSIFVETSVNSKGIESIISNCKSKGYDIKIGGNLYSDALGKKETLEGTYIGAFSHNTRTIVDNLK